MATDEIMPDLVPTTRNYLKSGDWIETKEGVFAKVDKLEYNEAHTNKGVIKKSEIKQVHEPAIHTHNVWQGSTGGLYIEKTGVTVSPSWKLDHSFTPKK